MAAKLRSAQEDDISFRALAETIPQLVWATRPDGVITYANVRFLDYLGITSEVFATWRLKDWVHPDDARRANDTWRHALLTGEPYEIEYRLRSHEGEHHWFLVRGTPVRVSDATIVGWFGTCTPIDRQRAAFERQQRIIETFASAFVPRALPTLHGVTIDAVYSPADEEARVGGDWYDVVARPDGTILIVIGDVTGHGPLAALSMAKLRQAIVGASIDIDDPAQILTRGAQFFALLDEAIATVLVAALDPATGRVRYASAGHPAPILATVEQARSLAGPSGLPVGIDPGAPYETFSHTLRRDELLVFYTDGLIEAHRDLAPDEARVHTAARDAAAGAIDAAGIRAAVIGSSVTADDIAVLTLRLT